MNEWPYCTTRWRKLRLRKLRADPLCEYCAPERVTVATAVDHREAIAVGGPIWDWSNLVSTCWPCHSRKTARGPEKGIRRTDKPEKGCRVDGTPLDPRHPWGA